MFSNIFCFLAAIYCIYLVFDGQRKGSILLKGGHRACRDKKPGSFYFWTIFYSGTTLMLLYLPFAGIDLFSR